MSSHVKCLLSLILAWTATIGSPSAIGQVRLPPPVPAGPTYDSRPQGAAPTNVQTPSVGPFSVVLQWQVPACATGYVLRRSDGMVWQSDPFPPAGNCPAATGTVTTRTGVPVKSLRGLTPEVYSYTDPVRAQSSYQYVVGAVYADSKTGWAPAVAVTTPPAPNPVNFTATHDPAGNVTLRWDPLSTASGYVLSGGGLPTPRTIAATSTTLLGLMSGPHVWSLVANHATSYGVTANTVRPSRAALMVAGPVPWYSPGTPMDQTLCNPPQTLPGPGPVWIRQRENGPAMSLEWPMVAGAVAYVVERSIRGTNVWTLVGSTCGGPARIEVSDNRNNPNYLGWVNFMDVSGGIVPGTLYDYRVKAIGMAGETGLNTTTSWRPLPPGQPSMLPVRIVTNTVVVRWTYSSGTGYSAGGIYQPAWTNEADQYRISSEYGWSETKAPWHGINESTIHGVPQGTHTFTVTAQWVDPWSPKPHTVYASTSNTITVTIP